MGRRFRLGEAEFIDLQLGGGSLSISCSHADVADQLREAFSERLGPPARHGLAVVVTEPTLPGARRVIDLFDASGYRIWRGREVGELIEAIRSVLTPVQHDPPSKRVLLDLRPLLVGDSAVLVCPRVMEDARVLARITRSDWSAPAATHCDVDLATGELTMLTPLSLSGPIDTEEVSRHNVRGIILPFRGWALSGAADAMESLARTVLDTKHTAGVREAAPTLRRLVTTARCLRPDNPDTAEQATLITEFLKAIRSSPGGHGAG